MLAHALNNCVDHFAQKWSLDTQSPAVTNGTTCNAPQHVLASAVAGDDTVEDQERHRAGVVCQDTQRVVRIPFLSVADASNTFGSLDDGLKQVRVIRALEPERD